MLSAICYLHYLFLSATNLYATDPQLLSADTYMKSMCLRRLLAPEPLTIAHHKHKIEFCQKYCADGGHGGPDGDEEKDLPEGDGVAVEAEEILDDALRWRRISRACGLVGALCCHSMGSQRSWQRGLVNALFLNRMNQTCTHASTEAETPAWI